MTRSTFTRGCAMAAFTAAAAFFAYAQLPSDLDAVSRARLPFLKKEEVGEKGKRVVDIFGKDGTVKGPLAFAAYNGAVATALLDLHDAAIAGSLDAHTRELAIMVACKETNYDLEWNGHQAAALRAGVEASVLDIVRTGRALDGVNEKDAAVIRFGRELYRDKKVAPATFAKVVSLWGRRGAMDMVAVMNTYAVSGFFAIAVDERGADGKQLPR